MEERRIEDLEVKVAFLEHHIATLDELLRVALERLEQVEGRLRELDHDRPPASVRGSLEDEVPPHHVRL